MARRAFVDRQGDCLMIVYITVLVSKWVAVRCCRIVNVSVIVGAVARTTADALPNAVTGEGVLYSLNEPSDANKSKAEHSLSWSAPRSKLTGSLC